MWVQAPYKISSEKNIRNHARWKMVRLIILPWNLKIKNKFVFQGIRRRAAFHRRIFQDASGRNRCQLDWNWRFKVNAFDEQLTDGSGSHSHLASIPNRRLETSAGEERLNIHFSIFLANLWIFSNKIFLWTKQDSVWRLWDQVVDLWRQ